MLPTFILIGAMKAGTTSLAGYLRAHPDVFMTTPKEPQYFGGFRRNRHDFAWYERLYDGAGDARARGESSTTYTMAPHIPHVPQRIAAAVPDAGLVYLVRNPVERIRSQYVHHVDAVGERRPLETMIAEEPALLDYSRYGFQLDAYLECFPREQILVVSSESLRSDPAAALDEVYRFLGVDSLHAPRHLRLEHNRGERKLRTWRIADRPRALLRRLGVLDRLSRPTKQRLRRLVGSPVDATITPEVEAQIWEQLAPDLRRLRAIVGPGFDLWGRA